jgi:hypothetical protein
MVQVVTSGVMVDGVLGSERARLEIRSASTLIIVRNAAQVTDSNDSGRGHDRPATMQSLRTPHRRDGRLSA